MQLLLMFAHVASGAAKVTVTVAVSCPLATFVMVYLKENLPRPPVSGGVNVMPPAAAATLKPRAGDDGVTFVIWMGRPDVSTSLASTASVRTRLSRMVYVSSLASGGATTVMNTSPSPVVPEASLRTT